MAKTIDQIIGSIEDALAISSLSAAKMAARLQARNGADSGLLLTAALEVARNQANEIAKLKRTIRDAEQQQDILREDLDAREADIRRLKDDFASLSSNSDWLGQKAASVLAPASIVLNTPQRRDALELVRALPDGCAALAFFDPQHRGVLEYLDFGNEGARQRGRAGLSAMTDTYIDWVCVEIARALRPGGYLMRWVDTFCLCEADHRRIADVLKAVDLIAWDSLRIGMGKRSRRRGDYLLILQKAPISARTWKDHGIPSRWPEKVDRKVHPHIKPVELISRLIAAVTEPGDLIVDPAAGSFTVMHAARRLGRNFTGGDLIEWGGQ